MLKYTVDCLFCQALLFFSLTLLLFITFKSMASSDKVKSKYTVSLIGCGRIGFLLEQDPLRKKPCTHYGGLRAAGLKVNFAVDQDANRLDAFIKTAGINETHAFLKHTALFERHVPEIAVISTWTPSHNEIAMDAAKNGVNCIVLEKPVSHSLQETKKLLTLCEETGTSIIVNHERRFDSRYRKVKELIESGKIGELRSVHGKMLTGGYRGTSMPSEGGGPLLHDGTHLIDICRFFFGDVRSVEGEFQRFGRKRGYEDRATAWLKTESGVDIFLEAGGAHKYFLFELEIYGTEGKILIGNGYEKLYASTKSKLYSNFRDLAEVPFPKYKNDNCFINVYKEAINILNGTQNVVTSSLLDGYKALEIVHSIYYSATHNRRNIKLPMNPSKINLKKIFKL